MTSWFMWPVTLASVWGTWLNIKHRRVCFAIWAGTNFLWCIYDLWLHAYPQAALMAVYFCLSIVGLYKWRKASAPAIAPEQEYKSHPYMRD